MIKAIFTNTTGILFSRVTGFVRDLLTASILGVNIYSDIFFVAFQFPNLFRRVFGEGAFSQTFLPTFIRVRKKGLFSASIFYRLVSAILILTILVYLFDSEVTKMIAIGFDSETIEKATTFVKINFWYLLLVFWTTFLSALLHYREHFATTAYSTALLNISLISALLLSKGGDGEQIVYFLSYGVLIGGLLQVIAHLIAIRIYSMDRLFFGGLLRFHRLDEVESETRGFFKRFLFAIWGGGTAQISSFLDTLLASLLATGSISYLYFANRVFQFPLALFAIATTTAIFPRVSKYIQVGNQEKAEELFREGFWILLSLLSIATIIGVLFSEEIISLLFERGAFGVEDRIATARVLRYYLFGLVIFGIAKLFSLWLYAHEKMDISAKISTYSLIVKMVSAPILVYSLDMGVAGLAFSTTISSGVVLVLTLREFGWKRFGKIFTKEKM